MNELKLISPISPSVNHYLAYRVVKKGNKYMAISYKTKDAKDYQEVFTKYVKKEAEIQGWIKSENKYQHYYVDTVYYFPRIDMDCNNYWKVPFDSITESGAVWIDDNQACERVDGIYYDSKNPRIEFTIRPVDYIGIFKNKEYLKIFEEKCFSCSKYKDGKCSILNKAKEGRIQEEVEDLNCLKYKIKN